MRIAYVIPEDFAPAYARHYQVAQTVRALAETGAEVHLLKGRESDGGTGFDRLRIPTPPGLHIHGLPLWRKTGFLRFSWNGVFDWHSLLCLRRLARGRELDAIYVRHLKLARWLLRFRSWLGVPIIFEIHEMFFLGRTSGRKRRRLESLERRVYRAVDATAAISLPLARVARETFALPALPEVIPSAVDPALFVPRHSAPPPERLLYLGQFYPWKGVDTLVEAMALLPEGLQCDLVGGRPGSGDFERIESRIAALGLAPRVHLHGFIAQDRLRPFFEQAYLAVLPASAKEIVSVYSSPLKLFEYLGSGIPIVATDLPCFAGILEHGRNAFLTPPDDPAALAQGIATLIADPALAARLGQNGLKTAQGFSWHARAGRILKLVERVGDL